MLLYHLVEKGKVPITKVEEAVFCFTVFYCKDYLRTPGISAEGRINDQIPPKGGNNPKQE